MNEPVILFFGEDTFHIKSKINQIIKKYDVDSYNTTYYDLDEVVITEAINDAWTIPFMSDLKIIICQNAYFLSADKPKKSLNHDLDLLMDYLKKPSSTTVFILVTQATTLDGNKSILKQLKNHKIVECKLKSGKDLVSWARRQVGNLSMTITNDALEEFIRRVEHSTEFAYLEMKKLLLYAEGSTKIDIEMIKHVITKNVEANVYEITNAILARNHQKALEIYRDLILYSEDPLRILSTIVLKYREMLIVKTLLEQGKDQTGIQEYFKVSSGRAFYMVQNSRTVHLEKIKTHLAHLEKLDYHIKTGRIDKKTAIELFILST